MLNFVNFVGLYVDFSVICLFFMSLRLSIMYIDMVFEIYFFVFFVIIQ